jgi:hypothetical protein
MTCGVFRFGALAVMPLVVLAAAAGCGSGIPVLDPDVEVVEVTDYKPPPVEDDGLADDRLEDKQTAFDPELVDRRPLGEWLVNQSEAVIRLDVPMARPDRDAELLVLRASYADALAAAKQHRSWMDTLPSVNLIDGKAKQFDDGLYAAIDQAYFQGIEGQLESHLSIVSRMLEAAGPDSAAAPYLAAGLTLGGQEASAADNSHRDKLVRQFQANPALAKPIGFYNWTPTLQRCWAMLRFFQQPLGENDPIVAEIVRVLQADSALAADYEQAARFYGKLSNPLGCLTPADLVESDPTSASAIGELRASRGIRKPGVALYPPSSSRETELFERLFPLGVPEGANLMRELVRRIRSGEVDLTPRDDSGWYEHQVYALETLLLPERGEEQHKLLLTRAYKKRMLEAFAALMTKRRETHARQMPAAEAMAPPFEQPQTVAPRLRVEPCPSYFVRTARSYAFLHDFLMATLGEETLRQLHGLRKDGQRERDLASELAQMRDLFYGLYLVSCDDIGLRPQLADEEILDPHDCYEVAALAWLATIGEDRDLAEDTRVAVPIYIDPVQGTMRLWVTLGVRLTQLDTRYARPPQIRPAAGGDWQQVEPHRLEGAKYLIAVDEFAEVEVSTLSPPNRDELRKLCDEHQTKEQIVAALAAGRW